MRLLLFSLSLLLLGCSSHPLTQNASSGPGFPAPSFGEWHNPYAGNPNLAAVAITSGLSNPYDQWGFVHTRPNSLSFAFWDGRVRQVQLRSDGTVWDDFWWPPKARLQPGSAAWAGFNFNYGSDPTFLRHRDPRLPTPTPVPVAMR